MPRSSDRDAIIEFLYASIDVNEKAIRAFEFKAQVLAASLIVMVGTFKAVRDLTHDGPILSGPAIIAPLGFALCSLFWVIAPINVRGLGLKATPMFPMTTAAMHETLEPSRVEEYLAAEHTNIVAIRISKHNRFKFAQLVCCFLIPFLILMFSLRIGH